MSFATGHEGAMMLLPCLRHDIEQGYVGIAPTESWFQVRWGYFTKQGRKTDWYILIRLPSYSMRTAIWRDGPPTWHQLVLVFKEKLPGDGPWGDGVWRVDHWECSS